jgi:hypothetical protein
MQSQAMTVSRRNTDCYYYMEDFICATYELEQPMFTVAYHSSVLERKWTSASLLIISKVVLG